MLINICRIIYLFLCLLKIYSFSCFKIDDILSLMITILYTSLLNIVSVLLKLSTLWITSLLSHTSPLDSGNFSFTWYFCKSDSSSFHTHVYVLVSDDWGWYCLRWPEALFYVHVKCLSTLQLSRDQCDKTGNTLLILFTFLLCFFFYF